MDSGTVSLPCLVEYKRTVPVLLNKSTANVLRGEKTRSIPVLAFAALASAAILFGALEMIDAGEASRSSGPILPNPDWSGIPTIPEDSIPMAVLLDCKDPPFVAENEKESLPKGLEQANRLSEEPLVKAIREHTTFVVREVQVEGDKAEATVDITLPDLSSALPAMMAEMMGGEGDAEQKMRDFSRKLAERIENGELETTTISAPSTLVKEGGRWKVKSPAKPPLDRLLHMGPEAPGAGIGRR